MYHVTTAGERVWAPHALDRPGDRLVKPFRALRAVHRLVATEMMRRTRDAEHLAHAESRCAGHESVLLRLAAVGLETRVD